MVDNGHLLAAYRVKPRLYLLIPEMVLIYLRELSYRRLWQCTLER